MRITGPWVALVMFAWGGPLAGAGKPNVVEHQREVSVNDKD